MYTVCSPTHVLELGETKHTASGRWGRLGLTVKGTVHLGGQLELTGHVVSSGRKQGKMGACVQLPDPALGLVMSTLGVDLRTNLIRSSHAYQEPGLLGDARSCQVDSQYYTPHHTLLPGSFLSASSLLPFLFSSLCFLGQCLS